MPKKTGNARARIVESCDRIDRHEGSVQAFVPGTYDRARILSDFEALAERGPQLPFLGCLIGAKDIIRAEGYETRCGSKLPPTLFAGPEASCVSALKKAGAVVAGKTVTAEFAGWHPGPTGNPHNLAHTPGGSSSGSAAGVAAGFFPLALGSQTAGSIIRPAAYCGVIGFKPSLGLVPTDGVIPYSRSIDHLGLMARDLDILEAAMTALVPGWARSAVAETPRVAVPTGPYLDQAAPAARAHFEATLAALESAGFAVRRQPALQEVARLNADLDALTYGEAFRVHEAWMRDHRDLYSASTLEGLAEGAALTEDDLVRLRGVARDLRERLDVLMASEGIDLWAALSAPDTAPHGLAATGDPCMNAPWTFAGLPALTLPSGLGDESLPYGLQLVARFGADAALIAWGRQIQEVIGRLPLPETTG